MQTVVRYPQRFAATSVQSGEFEGSEAQNLPRCHNAPRMATFRPCSATTARRNPSKQTAYRNVNDPIQQWHCRLRYRTLPSVNQTITAQ